MNPSGWSRPTGTPPILRSSGATHGTGDERLAIILKKEPKLRHLTEVLTSIQHRYESLGVQLEVDLGVIESIKRSNDDDGVKLKNILTKWMEACDPPVTWETVVNIVGRNPITNNSLKEDILKFLTNLSDEELEGPQPAPTYISDINETHNTRYTTQQPHLPSSSSARVPLSPLHNREPHGQVSLTSSATTRQPHDETMRPFVIVPKRHDVYKCFGCGYKIFNYVKLVVKHQDVRKYTRNRRGKARLCSRHGNVYYHLKMSCIVERHGRFNLPPFVVSDDARPIIPTLTPRENREFKKFNITI